MTAAGASYRPNAAGKIKTARIGVAVLIGFDSFRGATLQAAGHSAVLVAACFYACAAIFGRRFRGLPPVVVAAGMLTAATIMMAPVALLVDHPWLLSPGWITWGAIAGLAVMSTAIAFTIYFRVLASAGTNILLVTFLIPVSALLLGVFILGERPGWNTAAGMVLILGGLTVIDGRLPMAVRSLWHAAPRPPSTPGAVTPEGCPYHFEKAGEQSFLGDSEGLVEVCLAHAKDVHDPVYLPPQEQHKLP